MRKSATEGGGCVLREILERRELLGNLVVRNLKIRYKNSFLGFFWTLLDPLFMMLVYFVFLRILRFSQGVPSLLVGVVAWQFFMMCSSDSLNAVTGHSNLVKRTFFPREILPLGMVAANVINFLLALVALTAFLLVYGLFLGAWPFLSVNLLLLPAVILLQSCLCLGLSMVFSSLNVFFRDTEHIVGVLLMAWFFLTPIIYPLEIVQERFPGLLFRLYLLNPMASLVSAYRAIFLGAGLPGGLFCILSLSVLPLLFLAGGWFLYSKLEVYFADEL